MFDPNLNIWALLLCVYVLYGFGYILGFAQGIDEKDKPGPVELCFVIVILVSVWPFVKGIRDGMD